MWKFLNYLKMNLVVSLPLFMLSGLICGIVFNNVFILKSFIMPLTFLMVYPMMVNLKFRELFFHWELKLQVVAFLINFLLIPLFAWQLSKIFFADDIVLSLGLLLMALLPTSGMTISWTGFARGNIHAAVKMTIIGLILGAILTPIYLNFFAGQSINIPLNKVFKQIVLLVFLPMLAGYITKRLLLKYYGNKVYQEKIAKKFSLLSTLGVLLIVFVAMTLKSSYILHNPGLMIKIFMPILIFYFVNYILITIFAKLLFCRENAIALIYGTVMRNLSIALAIAVAVFKDKGEAIALIIALAYVVQVQSAVWYIKLTNRFYGTRQT